MKTKKLKYKPEFNFKLIGVSTSEEDYKLSWKLSHILETGFVKSSNLQIIDPKYSDYLVFSVFENVDKTVLPDIRLVSNKGNSGFLIEELRNIDFFVIVYELDDTNFCNELVVKLKGTENVTGVFNLEPESLKSREKLLF